ncbi:hypothetical protein P171DRAFT_473917 [Karstenula rhodostoma CBS 690.94]|uniref:ABC transporter domain-containing protein n=1 Tax=Karstenula rhodostoma CBS 690.94 TaxID=1392251 RepID=A0A9P4PGY4_9PLEO|nr:hypothetical protein P171DRAFT_473917 [Karstenula rhodostoma CBS 690.94]
MSLLIRQIWALVRKNLLLICFRRPIATFIRAIAIPLVVVLVVSHTKDFFASPLKNGISSPHNTRSLQEGLAASNGRDIVGFVSNGMQGEVSQVIDALSKTIKDAGKSPKQFNSTQELSQTCVTNEVVDDSPKCFAAVVFLFSPKEGTDLSSKGTWNYTIRVDPPGGFADVTQDRNNAEIYTVPLQRAVNAEIVSRWKSGQPFLRHCKASFKSQLSGSIMVVIALVFAVLPQTLYEQTSVVCGVLSFIFPLATYTYFITGPAVFEAYDFKMRMWSQPPDDTEDPHHWRLNNVIHWVFLAIQIAVYPIPAFLVEQARFSTASPYSTFVQPPHEHAPTVTLTSFSKTYKAGPMGGIFKRRRDVHAVTDMSRSAYRRQILCLLGPNGSAKSTTMNCIAGLHKVTSGTVAIDPSRGLGYAPQNNVIWPDLTVEEHIASRRGRIKAWIAATFANAMISRETQGGQVRFEVPAEGPSLGGLIALLERDKDALGVEFYTVGKATLDEVFEKIVKRYGEYAEK